jgi:hypothetical protein
MLRRIGMAVRPGNNAIISLTLTKTVARNPSRNPGPIFYMALFNGHEPAPPEQCERIGEPWQGINVFLVCCGAISMTQPRIIIYAIRCGNPAAGSLGLELAGQDPS